MKTLTTIAFACLALAGCDKPVRTQAYDQCLRQQLFARCMASLPKGPERVGAAANDWDEVVSECGSQAAKMSIRAREIVLPACRMDW